MKLEDEERFAWQVGSGHRSHFMYASVTEALVGAQTWLDDNPNVKGRIWVWRQTTEVVDGFSR